MDADTDTTGNTESTTESGEVAGLGTGWTDGDWRSTIEDEKARRFADRFTSPADAAKAAFNFRQKLSNAIAIPGKGASEEDISEFHQRMGVPESPDGYTFTMPEGQQVTDKEKGFHGAMAEVFHKAGVTSEQAALLNQGWNNYLGVMQDMVRKANEEASEATAAELVREWGGDHKGNVEAARRAIGEFGGSRFTSFVSTAEVDGQPLGDHPEFLRIFATIGRRMGEDAFQGGMGTSAGGGTQKRLDEIHSWQYSSDPDKREKYRSQSVQEELRGIYTRIYGDEPIVGVDGRKL